MSAIKTKPIAQFSVQHLQFINENSTLTQALPKFADHETLLKLYQQMTLVRALDTKAVNLQRTGRMGTYPSSQGQEAIGVGMGFVMHKDDVFCPYYRDQGALLQRGIKISEILSYWGGDERGSDYSNNAEDFPCCVPIAGQCLHATGVAYAMKYRKQQRCVVTTIGEGGTSKGDFYEALNVAGAWNLPVVFVVNNNQWAISVKRDKQTGCQTIAQKAIAAGFEGIQVDGNDVVAVTYAMMNAVEQARKNQQPALIEAISYRLCDHTTADDASRYRSAEEHKEAWKREPIARLGYYLESEGVWSREQEAQLQTDCSAAIEKAVNVYLNQAPQQKTDFMDYLFAELPDAMIDQRDQLAESNL
jgi:2-oxoisovalerate dehydrogenase E1 component alpha subunit